MQSEKKIVYRVNWDNGANDCGTFSQRFDNYEDAEAWADDWADECNLRDFGTRQPEHDLGVIGYSAEVIETQEDDNAE